MKDKKIGRRTFLKTAALAAAATSAGTIIQPLTVLADKPGSSPVHGVCWMGGGHICKATYVDLGPVNKKGTHPVWVLRSIQGENAPNNPFDSGENYSPQRLQNNVFEGGGRLWPMWLVWSGNLDLYASTDGTVTLYSEVWHGDGRPTRDLTLDPIKSGDELLALAEAGDIILFDTGLVVDCPMTSADEGDVVVDLNPSVGPFCNRSK